MNVLKIAHYRILENLGSGASANVYLAEDTRLLRKVALKVLRRGSDRAMIDSLLDEARCTSRLNHPNIVTIYDFGWDDLQGYIVSEHIEGTGLRELMQKGPLPLDQALHVAIGLACALEAAHESWLVHRDIKPENIMIAKNGTVKVLDFGVARTRTLPQEIEEGQRRRMIGTLRYLSPEQVRGDEIIDTRSDLFSAGVVLYEMLMGDPPFQAETTMDLLASIVEAEPAPLATTVPPVLHTIVSRALQKDIQSRYQLASDLRSDLERVQFELRVASRTSLRPFSRSKSLG